MTLKALKKKIAVAAVAALVLCVLQAAASVSDTKGQFSDGTMTLPGIVRKTMAMHFGVEGSGQSIAQFANTLCVQERFARPAGLFVTLSRFGHTRACWGSVNPQHGSVARACVYTTCDALRKDYRFKPISRQEFSKLHVQVTVVRELQPISGSSELNPLRDGVMVRCGGRGGVILPGEATDGHYEIVLCKLKAGIKPGEPCQLYKMKVEIYD